MATASQSALIQKLDTKQRSSTSRHFEEALREKIVGQDEAVQALVELYQAHELWMRTVQATGTSASPLLRREDMQLRVSAIPGRPRRCRQPRSLSGWASPRRRDPMQSLSRPCRRPSAGTVRPSRHQRCWTERYDRVRLWTCYRPVPTLHCSLRHICDGSTARTECRATLDQVPLKSSCRPIFRICSQDTPVAHDSLLYTERLRSGNQGMLSLTLRVLRFQFLFYRHEDSLE